MITRNILRKKEEGVRECFNQEKYILKVLKTLKNKKTYNLKKMF